MGKLDAAQAVLVFVDVQERLWPHMQDREHVGRRIGQIVEIAGLLGIPILATEQYPKGLGPTIPELRAQLDKWNAGPAIEKRDFSCIKEPRFDEALTRLGRKTLLVCGIEAHVCVMQTVLDAIDREYDVHLVSEAVSSRSESDRALGLERMREAGAIMTSVEMAAFEAMRTAAHPRFREIQRVIL